MPPPSLAPEMVLKPLGAVMATVAFLLCAGNGQAQIQADHSFADTCDVVGGVGAHGVRWFGPQRRSGAVRC